MTSVPDDVGDFVRPEGRPRKAKEIVSLKRTTEDFVYDRTDFYLVVLVTIEKDDVYRRLPVASVTPGLDTVTAVSRRVRLPLVNMVDIDGPGGLRTDT